MRLARSTMEMQPLSIPAPRSRGVATAAFGFAALAAILVTNNFRSCSDGNAYRAASVVVAPSFLMGTAGAKSGGPSSAGGGGVFGPAEEAPVNTASEDVRSALNTPEAEKARWDEAVSTDVDLSAYRHVDANEVGVPGRSFLKLLLRTVTGNLPGKPALPEPWREKWGRTNGGCIKNNPECILTWDGWARAMAAGEVLFDVLKRGVTGEVVEVGVFKGGLSSYLQGVLITTGEATAKPKGREMWLVDSFQGLPPTSLMVSSNDKTGDAMNSAQNQDHWAGGLSVGQMTVRDNLDRLGLLDYGNVNFLEGWVQDTLPGWGNNSTKPIALLRIDVDIYSATYDALHFLYPHLEKGGAVLFDDWKLDYSMEAILNYRKEHGITTPVRFLHGCKDPMAYWIKE